MIAAEFHTHCHRALELRDETLVKVLDRTDAFRRPGRFEQFVTACEADARGRTGFEKRDYPQADYLRGALQAASDIDAAGIARDSDAERIGEAIRSARIAAVREWRNSL